MVLDEEQLSSILIARIYHSLANKDRNRLYDESYTISERVTYASNILKDIRELRNAVSNNEEVLELLLEDIGVDINRLEEECQILLG